MKLDFYYSLEAMQHAGSINLWENVNIHRHISNPKITLQRWTAIRIYTHFCFCIFIFILLAWAQRLFTFIIQLVLDGYILHTVVYLLICQRSHTCSQFYMYLWVLICVTEEHERSHTEMFQRRRLLFVSNS